MIFIEFHLRNVARQNGMLKIDNIDIEIFSLFTNVDAASPSPFPFQIQQAQ